MSQTDESLRWECEFYLLGVLPACYLNHRVEGVCIRQSLGSHCESDHNPLPPLCHTPHQLSILYGDTGCRDALHSILVVLPTRVGTREGETKRALIF